MATFKNDMTMMYVTHNAFRRDLDHIARVTARIEDDPKHILRVAVGWEMFKSYLHVHHTAEDRMLWPPLRDALANDAGAMTLLDAMEAEHGAIDPLITDIDAALVDRHTGPARLGELTDTLAAALRGHLAHEETDGLPLIDAAITAEQWRAFSSEGGKLVGGDVSRFMPWVLDGAPADVNAYVLDRLPPQVQDTYRDEWQPAYAAIPLWGQPLVESEG